MDNTKQSNITKHREGIRGTVLCGLFAAIIAVLTLVTIPMPSGVPITLQTFAVALCGYSLGCAKGTAATFVYVALGAVGLPVFSGMKGGFSVLVGPTGGYIYGFVGMAVLCGLGAYLFFRLTKRKGAVMKAQRRVMGLPRPLGRFQIMDGRIQIGVRLQADAHLARQILAPADAPGLLQEGQAFGNQGNPPGRKAGHLFTIFLPGRIIAE